jgi:hypothetical protein
MRKIELEREKKEEKKGGGNVRMNEQDESSCKI